MPNAPTDRETDRRIAALTDALAAMPRGEHAFRNLRIRAHGDGTFTLLVPRGRLGVESSMAMDFAPARDLALLLVSVADAADELRTAVAS